VPYGPCLLVSREYGCGGGVIARRVGERLGWNVFDREIVNEIAQVGHFRERLVESVDERVRTYWERAWREILTDDNIGDENYLRYLRQVIMSLGHHGQVVIVGRGAQFMLPPACALRVRVVAPLKFRIAQVSQREQLSPDRARARILKNDAARRNFVWTVFKSVADSSITHDMVLNTGEITIDAATAIVLTALREKLGVRPEPSVEDRS
jgi:cytidylate kinase